MDRAPNMSVPPGSGGGHSRAQGKSRRSFPCTAASTAPYRSRRPAPLRSGRSASQLRARYPAPGAGLDGIHSAFKVRPSGPTSADQMSNQVCLTAGPRGPCTRSQPATYRLSTLWAAHRGAITDQCPRQQPFGPCSSWSPRSSYSMHAPRPGEGGSTTPSRAVGGCHLQPP